MELSTTDIFRRIETESETLVVDGMLSGTGIRLKYAGGFIKLDQLPISTDLKKDISTWVLRYQNEHFENFQRVDVNAQLDNHGLKIVENLRETLGTNSVVYFSNAYMRYL